LEIGTKLKSIDRILQLLDTNEWNLKKRMIEKEIRHYYCSSDFKFRLKFFFGAEKGNTE